MKKMTIQLTSDQQKQIKEATGKNISTLNIDLTATGSLSEKDLEKVQGGAWVIHRHDKSSP
jgi:hypothetical protein